MRLSIFTLLLFLSSNLFAQVTIGLEDGRTYQHQKMKLKGSRIIADDTITYYKDQVDFYSNEEGYFKKRKFGQGGYEFMFRVGEGAIETYSVWRSVTSMNPNTGLMTTNSSKQFFYALEGGEIKKMKYKHLIKDIGHIPECRAYLKKAKTAQAIGVTSLIAGLGVFIGTAVGELKKVESNSSLDDSSIPPGVFVGAALCFGPMISRIPAMKNYRRAIEYYNEHR